MQDKTPPLTDSEIQALIAEYLDATDPGSDPDKTAYLQQVLAQHPEYMEEFIRQRDLKSSFSSLAGQLHHSGSPEPGAESLWDGIAAQLKQDRQAEVKPYDEAFISAYYDGEIPSDDPERTAFEAQLFNNVEANRVLADIGEISDRVRQFAYRLEESCTVDVAASVMAQYAAERSEAGGVLDESVALEPMFETLSALYDQELSARETIAVNGEIESNDDCRRLLADFNELSGHIQSLSEQIQQQAPDLLPRIAEQLPGIVAENTAQKRATLLPFKKRVAIPSVAAALLLLVVGFGLLSPNASQQPEGLLVEQAGLPPYEIAVLPRAGGEPSNFHPAHFTRPVAEGEYGDDARLSGTKPRRMAAVSPVRTGRGTSVEEIPSAEEYLFQMLEQKVEDRELPLLLGANHETF